MIILFSHLNLFNQTLIMCFGTVIAVLVLAVVMLLHNKDSKRIRQENIDEHLQGSIPSNAELKTGLFGYKTAKPIPYEKWRVKSKEGFVNVQGDAWPVPTSMEDMMKVRKDNHNELKIIDEIYESAPPMLCYQGKHGEILFVPGNIIVYDRLSQHFYSWDKEDFELRFTIY